MGNLLLEWLGCSVAMNVPTEIFSNDLMELGLELWQTNMNANGILGWQDGI